MRCPLCGGPLHLGSPDSWCDRGHRLDHQQLREASAGRITMAFWMAIEALENEADLLQSLGGPADGTNHGSAEQLALQAKEDARILREFAGRQLPPVSAEQPDS